MALGPPHPIPNQIPPMLKGGENWGNYPGKIPHIRAKQIIMTSAVSTATVSPLATLIIACNGFSTAPICANACANAASIIAIALTKRQLLHSGTTNGQSTGARDEGCEMEVTLLSVTDNPDCFK